MILYLLHNIARYHLISHHGCKRFSKVHLVRVINSTHLKEIGRIPGKRISLAIPKSIYLSQYRVAHRVRQHNARNNDGDTCGRAIGSRPAGKIALPPIIRFDDIIYNFSLRKDEWKWRWARRERG